MMPMLKFNIEVARRDKIRNEYIKWSLIETSVVEKKLRDINILKSTGDDSKWLCEESMMGVIRFK